MIRLFRVLLLKRRQSKALALRKAARTVKQQSAAAAQSTQWRNRYGRHIALWGNG